MKEKCMNTRKYGRYSGIVLFLLLFLFSLLPSVRTEAAQLSLNLDNNWVSGSIDTKGDADFYRFYVPQAGFVHIDYQAWSIRASYIEIWNADLTDRYSKYSVYYSSDTNPLTKEQDFGFEPGYYYAKVYAGSGNIGSYKIRGSFRAAANNETEPNDGFEQAMTLGTNQKVTGFFSQTDSLDFYRIVIPATQKVRLTYTSRVRTSRFTVWDSDFQQISKKDVYYASEESPLTFAYEETLDAGTYYIKIDSNNGYAGTYQLVWEPGMVNVTNISVGGNKTVTQGSSFTLTAVITPSNAANKNVTWSSSNTGVATVSSAGKVTAKSAGTAVITATAADGSNVAGSVTVKVTAPVKVSSIKITGNKAVAAGSKLTLKAVASPKSAANRGVTWSTSNKAVATVSSKGVVTTKKAGSVKITAKAKDGSGVSKTVTVIVKPKKMAAPALSSTAKGKLKLSWKKQSGVSGYQIQYSAGKNFGNAVSRLISNRKSTVTLSGLKKKTYYVRIRAYVKVNGKTYYGSWSTVKSKKVK